MNDCRSKREKRTETALVGRAVLDREVLSALQDGGRKILESRKGDDMVSIRIQRYAACICFSLVIGIIGSCSSPQRPLAVNFADTPSKSNITGAILNFAPNDPPGECHSQARDYANTRFSPLDLSKAGEPVEWAFKPNPSPIVKGKA